ncbi:MAG: ABC transporter ATP-binding protein [Bacteroidota bacterium]|nr:ABC transporter ATP-binding protein [Candidatus Kapabacteria bacterium]MDW8218931.1 ABC transporter ATP-binding protein [Bacteroidota bacterium]
MERQLLPNITLEAQHVSHRFQRRFVWQNISLTVHSTEIWGVTGSNGSGKTTLLRVLTGLLTPTSGSVKVWLSGLPVDPEHIVRHVGFVSPYLTLYEEYTPVELCQIVARMRGIQFDRHYYTSLAHHVGLALWSHDNIARFSSGMKQRVRLILALLFRPALLVLDEPMTNLDDEGIACVQALIREHQQNGGACIIATNDSRDYELCTHILSLPHPHPTQTR